MERRLLLSLALAALAAGAAAAPYTVFINVRSHAKVHLGSGEHVVEPDPHVTVDCPESLSCSSRVDGHAVIVNVFHEKRIEQIHVVGDEDEVPQTPEKTGQEEFNGDSGPSFSTGEHGEKPDRISNGGFWASNEETYDSERDDNNRRYPVSTADNENTPSDENEVENGADRYSNNNDNDNGYNYENGDGNDNGDNHGDENGDNHNGDTGSYHGDNDYRSGENGDNHNGDTGSNGNIGYRSGENGDNHNGDTGSYGNNDYRSGENDDNHNGDTGSYDGNDGYRNMKNGDDQSGNNGDDQRGNNGDRSHVYNGDNYNDNEKKLEGTQHLPDEEEEKYSTITENNDNNNPSSSANKLDDEKSPPFWNPFGR